MRDDLHKTVPLANPWQRVLRRVSKDKWTADELAPLITGTVQLEFAQQDDEVSRALEAVLENDHRDLFHDGEESMRLSLLRLQDGAMSSLTRDVCELALGVLATEGMSEKFKNQVRQVAGSAYARNQIEHISSRIALVHGHKEAQGVRTVLSAALSLCDFSSPVDLRKAAKRKSKSLEELLSSELQLVD